jgi:geranylgeranyl reductase family protein
MPRPEIFDLIVIGAGPAGSAAAVEALKGGLSVAQIETHRFPRVKPCAGGMTVKSWNLLSSLPSNQCRGQSKSFEFNFWKRRQNRFSSSRPMLRFLHRPDFDQWLVERNRRFEHFRFLDGEPVKKISYDGLFQIRTEQQDLKGRQLVGADGAHSLVNRTFGIGRPRARATALEVVLSRDEVVRASSEEDIPCFDFGVIGKGYGWVFPKDDHWSAGLYTLDERPVAARKTLQKYLIAKGFRSEDKLLTSLKSHRYPVGGYKLEIPQLPVYLVGDAGGFAEAITGEGIYYALESGRLAGKVVCAAHAGQESPREYYRELRFSVLADTFLSYQLAERFYRNPGRWLKILEKSQAWRPLVQGYSEGRTLTQTLLAALPSLIRSVGKVRRGW